jgi:hypothetical protein
MPEFRNVFPVDGSQLYELFSSTRGIRPSKRKSLYEQGELEWEKWKESYNKLLQIKEPGSYKNWDPVDLIWHQVEFSASSSLSHQVETNSK